MPACFDNTVFFLCGDSYIGRENSYSSPRRWLNA